MFAEQLISNLKTHRTTYSYVLIIAVVAFLPYLNIFGFPFVFDDFHNIEENHWIKIRELSLSNLFNAASNGPSANRIFPNLSFALNFYLDGFNVWGYHLVNVTIHIFTSITLYFIACNTLNLQSQKNKYPKYREIALFTALVWAVHPLQTNAVTYIVQRMTSMATLFYLLSLLFFIKSKIHNEISNTKYFYFGMSFIFGIMAFFSKENTVILPFIMAVYFFFFLQKEKIHFKIKHLFLLLIPIIILIIFAFIYVGGNPLHNILNGYEGRNFTLAERLLTEPRILFYYISLILLPLPTRLNLIYDYTISNSIFSPPQTLLAIIGIGLLIYGIKYFYTRDKLLSFTIFWFLANLVIESTIIPLELIYEHRLYLPSTFIILYIIARSYKTHPNNIKFLRGIMIFTIIILSFFTWHRNKIWQSEISLWSDVVNKSPSLSRGYNNLGKALNIKGDYAEAERVLLKAIELEPDDAGAYINIARTYEKKNQLGKAYATFEKALTKNKKKGNTAKIYYNMGRIQLKQRNIPQAIELLSKALQLNPNVVNINHDLGVAYGMMGAHKKAEQFFLKSIELDPHNGHVYLQLAAAYEYQKRYQEALMILEKGRRNANVNHSQFDARINRLKRMLSLNK